MEHLDNVMLGVVDICALLWYAQQRARRWLLRLVWIAGAILGFVLVGPLALAVWAAASALFGSKLRNDGKRRQYRWVHAWDDMRIANEWQRVNASRSDTHSKIGHDSDF